MANEMSRERCLEVLGLQPGAAAQDFKAAYRDMAKVWHPDRFTHDLRLQQKAQEKLKEINDAYRQLLAGRFSTSRAGRATDYSTRDAAHAPRATDAPPAWHAQQRGTGETGVAVRPASRKVGRLVLVPALAFCATFAAVTPRLLSTRRHATPPATAAESAAEQPSREAQAEVPRDQTDAAALSQKSARRQALIDEARRANSVGYPGGAPPPIPTPVRAIPTVTASVDPSTGLLARADCPHKMSVTFPAGEEPHAYCNAEHRAAVTPPPANDDAAREKKSRLKSLAGRLASPTKWIGGGSQGEPAKKRPAGDQ